MPVAWIAKYKLSLHSILNAEIVRIDGLGTDETWRAYLGLPFVYDFDATFWKPIEGVLDPSEEIRRRCPAIKPEEMAAAGFYGFREGPVVEEKDMGAEDGRRYQPLTLPIRIKRPDKK